MSRACTPMAPCGNLGALLQFAKLQLISETAPVLWDVVDEEAGLWIAEYRVPGFPCRSSALKLRTGGFLIFSPGAQLAASFTQDLGRAELLLAPNSFHHAGFSKWQQAFPAAVLAAHPTAHKRLAKQGQTGLSDLKAARQNLPDTVTLLEPPATRIGEVWLRVESGAGVVWCIGDSFFNMPRLAKSFRTRILQRTLRSAPGLCHSNLMKWGGLRNRRVFKQWVLEQLDADEPSKIVVLHGDVVQHDAAEKLRALIHRRL